MATGRVVGNSYLLPSVITLFRRRLRPRAKAKSSSRSRRSHLRSSTRLGDKRMDSNRTCSYPLLSWSLREPYHTSSTTTCGLSRVRPPRCCVTTADVRLCGAARCVLHSLIYPQQHYQRAICCFRGSPPVRRLARRACLPSLGPTSTTTTRRHENLHYEIMA